MPGRATPAAIDMKIQNHFRQGPGDDEDEFGLLRPVDIASEDQDADETKAVQAGAGALID